MKNCLLLVSILGLSVPSILAAQNLFVAENRSGNISEFTSAGTQSTFSSGWSDLFGLAFNNAGDLFAATTNGIIKFAPNGAGSLFASEATPFALAFNTSGNLFVSDYGTGSIYEYTPNGVQSMFASGFSYPVGLAFNSMGDLFVADDGAGKIYELTPAGAQTTFASGLGPIALAFDSAGNLFEGDGSGNIYEFTPGGTRSTFASGLNFPFGLAFNSADDLFVADNQSGSIYEFAPDGTKSTFASGLNYPVALAFQVPEPSTWAMLGLGVLALLAPIRGKRMSAKFGSSRTALSVESN